MIKVKSKKSGEIYAMKMIQKDTVEHNNHLDQLMNEVNILQAIDHPNIIKMYSSFEDQKSVYLIMELSEKGNLYQVMDGIDNMDEQTASKVDM